MQWQVSVVLLDSRPVRHTLNTCDICIKYFLKKLKILQYKSKAVLICFFPLVPLIYCSMMKEKKKKNSQNMRKIGAPNVRSNTKSKSN